jgi:peptide/nickel transport system permease protein
VDRSFFGARIPTQAAIVFLALVHLVVLFAGFFAPYSFDTQNRDFVLAPPARLHFWDSHYKYHIHPFIYRRRLVPGTFDRYEEDYGAIFPVRFFVEGVPYSILGAIPSRRHLFGTDEQAPIALLGTDSYGRDEFSRLLYGGRISLFAGLAACSTAIGLGLLLGGLAGYYGGLLDSVIMRVSEVFLSMPWLYLLLSVRACLPLHMETQRAFLLLISLLGVVGWAKPARLIRGVVLTASTRDFVKAAASFGAGDFYLLRRHVLPQASTVALTQMALNIPQYILAEVTISFFGLGISQPYPSWGNMLASLESYFVLQSCWWMFAPAVALTMVLFTYHRFFSRFS